MSVEPIPDGVTEPGQNILDPDSIQQLKDLDESGENTLLHELCDAFLNPAIKRSGRKRGKHPVT